MRLAAARHGLTALLALLLTGAAAAVPLPRPRPAEAPKADAPQPEPPAPQTPATKADNPAEPAAPPPSACRLALTDAIAIAPSLPPIAGPGGCGGDDLVRLEAVVLADQSRVPLKPAATLRCSMAAAVADWLRGDVTALAAGLGTQVVGLDNFDSYNCRGRNRVAGAKLSEHGRANALDLRGIKLADGQTLALTERTTPRAAREAVLQSLCTRFTTVLGPGSDGYHEDHIHIDLAERRNGYRICQWDVWDPLPKQPPLLPPERPADAPPRELAAEPKPPAQEEQEREGQAREGQERQTNPPPAESSRGKDPKEKPVRPARGKAARAAKERPAEAAPQEAPADSPAAPPVKPRGQADPPRRKTGP